MVKFGKSKDNVEITYRNQKTELVQGITFGTDGQPYKIIKVNPNTGFWDIVPLNPKAIWLIRPRRKADRGREVKCR